MADFSHLQPAEKLFIARHRLKMLSNVLIEVLQLNEQKKAFVKSRLYEVGKDHAAVELLFDTIVHYEIVQICRLWDEFDLDAFSIPTVTNLLEGSDVRGLLTVEAAAQSDAVVNLRGASSTDFLELFDAAIKDAGATACSKQIQRVKNYRNKFIAHPLYRTRKDAKKTVDDVLPGDIEFAVERALVIVQVFKSALIPSGSDFGRVRSQVSRKLEEFYSALRYSRRN
jgi:HEPN superfamily AbiU2-like protein